jgi:peptide deformylase
MILPIVVVGDPVLKTEAAAVEDNSPALQQLIDDMIETMYGADGVGLAAPQVGQALQLFVVDARPALPEGEPVPEEWPEQPLVCINPEILDESEESCEMEEGCLSIPDLRDIVRRPTSILLRYLDRNFNEHKVSLDGFMSRVVQHEYDHLEGILFLEHLSAFRRRLHRRRLRDISAGRIETEYPITLSSPNVIT